MELKRNFRNFISPVRSPTRLNGVVGRRSLWERLTSNGIDSRLLAAILILSFLGLLNLAGISGLDPAQPGLGNIFLKKQIIFFIIGIFILFLGPLVDYRIFRNYSLPSAVFFGASIFLLLITLTATPVRGVTAWLHFPWGISFETSEIVKLAMILFMARFFSSRLDFNNVFTIFISGIYAFLAIFLVFAQPDLGSAFILLLIWLGAVILSGLTKRQILIAANSFIIIFLIVGLFVLQPYQKSRITSFLASLNGQGQESYNVLQAKIAIGSGGLLGLGFGSGSQARFGILPEPASDFALSALVEQFGFISLVLILILYFTILSRLLFIATRAKDNFSRFFIFMFLIYFFSQVIINIGMNLGILPVTGLPLPFISYGGSYFISLMIGFGIIESIRRRVA